MIKKQADIFDTAKVPLLPLAGKDSGVSMADEMDGEEIVCGCNGVTKGAIVDACVQTFKTVVENETVYLIIEE
ncbi:hypothetical protein AF332_19125 [Sporosarcina globispora]|uniref:Uncharacterized protein n=1 Tax=Sporosarcina globispora TaxID=1459 RepID=A0A0M0GG10_SPOGL|nr:hypothetical protein AF332_19125 [Sporosarcina globispora]